MIGSFTVHLTLLPPSASGGAPSILQNLELYLARHLQRLECLRRQLRLQVLRPPSKPAELQRSAAGAHRQHSARQHSARQHSAQLQENQQSSCLYRKQIEVSLGSPIWDWVVGSAMIYRPKMRPYACRCWDSGYTRLKAPAGTSSNMCTVE